LDFLELNYASQNNNHYIPKQQPLHPKTTTVTSQNHNPSITTVNNWGFGMQGLFLGCALFHAKKPKTKENSLVERRIKEVFLHDISSTIC
jgi:hypothetical protein